MSWHSVITSRLRALFVRDRLERELDDEVRFHLAMQADDNIRRGMDPVAAAHAARGSFGGRDVMKETYRSQRAFHLIETMAQDLRYALRAMRKNPGFTAVAVVSLALGIGANTVSFTVADALFLKPLPVSNPGSVLTVGSTTDVDRGGLAASYREYVDIRDRTRAFDGLAATTVMSAAITTRPDALPAVRAGALVSGNFFAVLGVEAALGRTFRPDEDQVPGRDSVVMLGHDFWTRQFGADPEIVGRAVFLNGLEFTVIGVVEKPFTSLFTLFTVDFYAPLMMWPRLSADDRVRPLDDRALRSVTIKGRLTPGVTIAQAQAELSAMAADFERAYPESSRHRTLAVRTELQDRMSYQPNLVTMLVMFSLLATTVLIVACVNVAGLLTSRASVRAREIALRLSIGAGRGRVIRQLFTENLVLACVGCVCGLGVGYGGVALFRLIQMPTDPPTPVPFALDGRAAAVAVAAALLSVVLFGLVPAVGSARPDLSAAMKATDAGSFGRRRQWGRTVLVGGQVAASVVLLVVALFVHLGFEQRLATGPGFRTEHLLTMTFDTSLLRYSDARAQRFFEQVVAQAHRVPGVKSATLSSFMLMTGGPQEFFAVAPEGFQFPEGQDSVSLSGSSVDEHYFETMGIGLLKGRGFRATDTADTPRVAIVNEQFARDYWPGQDPIGKRFRLDTASGPWAEIVGVVETSKYRHIMEPPTKFLYLPYRQRPVRMMSLLVESFGDPASLTPALREVVRSLDGSQPVFNVRTMELVYELRSTSQMNMIRAFIAVMGTMGLTLSIVGLYGLIAFAVGRRTREIGVRMAIGAERLDVLRMVLREGMVLALAGLGIGLLVSFGAARALGAVFPGGPSGDGRFDVAAFPIVAAAVMAVTLLATYVPARRASRVNPTEALRCD